MLLHLLLAATLATGLPPGDPPRAIEPVTVDGTAVVVDGAGDDPLVSAQVLRVLPRALRLAARWGALPPRVKLTIHPDHAGLEGATGRSGSPWMRAWASPESVDLQSPRTWSRGHASDEALAQILAHEFTHCALFQATGREGRAREVPFWFQEGMASVAAGEHHAEVHSEAVSQPGRFLRSEPRTAYGTADRAFRELVGRFGEEGVRRVVRALGEGQTFPSAFRDALGVSPSDFEAELAGRLGAVAARG